RKRALVRHHPEHVAVVLGDGEMAFVVRLRGPYPCRREQLHRVRMHGARAPWLVAEGVAEDPQHRLGAFERLGRIDVGPARVAYGAREERTARSEGPHAVGERRVALPGDDGLELLDERRTDAEDSRVDGVVVRELLGDLDDATTLGDDLRRVVDVEA